MQTKIASYGKRFLALMLSLLMLVSVMPAAAWAAADAKPEKITLAGSSEALDYEFVDYLTFAWNDIPHYKVTVPAGTKTVQLYGTVYLDSATQSGSGYTQKDGLNDWPPPVDYWTTEQVGSSAPYTIETRTSGYDRNLSLVKTQSYADTNTAYILEFVEQDNSPASPAPVLTADLSTAAVTYTCGDQPAALAVQATGTGALSYQWQMSTTSAADGFADIADATQSSYTPSTTAPGSFWYRVVVTNTAEGCKPASVTSAVTPVTVNVPAGMQQVKITTGVGYSKALRFTLKNSEGQALDLTADTSSGYAVYEFLTAPGVYTYEARDTVRGGDYLLGSGFITVEEGSGEQEFQFYLAYVYASNSSSWTADDFTTEVKSADGTVMTPGEPHKFASYAAYPYFMAPGSYTYAILPSETRVQEGYQATAPSAVTLSAKTSYATWSAKMSQVVTTTFTVPKGGYVTMTAAPSSTYGSGALVPGSADLTGSSDVYTFALTAGASYLYRAYGDGMLTNTGMFSASSKNASFDLTETMAGSPKAILRDGQLGAADVRLNGVDYTGSLALTVGGTHFLRPLRMWQVANDSTPTSRKAYPMEPDFHYTVVDVDGADVITVGENGLIRANSAGTAIVLVTYDAMHVNTCGWTTNNNKTFSAIWPENTGVVVVEVGADAASGPSANMTINSGDKKVAGNKLDAESDVLYYTEGSSCTYSFTPETGSIVTLLRPTLTDTAMTYTGGFGTDGVAVDGSRITLTLTEGKNIVRISKGGADTYQVITVKKAGAVIENKTNPGGEILPGDTVSVRLTGVYHPANWMANLQSLYAFVSYTDPGSGDTVTGYKNLAQRQTFDTADGDSCRTVEVKIPVDWDPAKPYALTDGAFYFHGNAKDIGSYRNSLANLSTATPYINVNSAFQLGSLPDITIPVSAPNVGTVTFSVKDDSGKAVKDAVIRLTNSTGDTITPDGLTQTLACGTWTYTVSKDGYLDAAGTLEITKGSDRTVDCVLALVTGLSIRKLPNKTVYTEGDTLDTTGLVVEAVTKSGSAVLSADQYTLSPTLLETSGQQVITVTYCGLTASFEVTVKEDIVTVETTLTDGITQKNSRMTFDVFAKDADGKKLPAREVTVLLNGSPVSVNWDDDVKTSYTLKFTQEGENIVTVKAHKVTLQYTIHYVKAQPGEVIGQAVFAIEAFTLGGGYIVEPCYVDIVEGENAAQALDRLLKAKGFTYQNTGTLESGFYLSHIVGDALSEIDVTGDSIPAQLRQKLDESGYTINPRSDANSLGEFDYDYASGWMYCLKNVFPNVGFADSYLSEGDVVRVQFTLAYGSDIGGGYAMGTGGTSYYPVANKDALTRRVAAINAEIDKDPYYLEKNCLNKTYDAAMNVLTTLYSTQAEVDAALANLPDPPVGHQLVEFPAKAPTCTENGSTAYWQCSVCQRYFGDAAAQDEITENSWVIPATGHAYGAPAWTWGKDHSAVAVFTCGNDASHTETLTAAVTSEVTAPAACEADGVRTYTAAVTFEGQTYTDTTTETIPATGHDTEVVGAKDATCTEDGYTGDEVCKTCGVTVTKGQVIPATGHDTELVGAKAATCTEDGYTGDEVCKICGETVKKGTVISATGHDTELVGAKDAACTEDGYTGDEVCKTCGETVKKGEVIPATGHDYKDGKCVNCGAADPDYQPEQPEKPEQPENPGVKTGDSGVLLYMGLMLLALTGSAWVLGKKRAR